MTRRFCIKAFILSFCVFFVCTAFAGHSDTRKETVGKKITKPESEGKPEPKETAREGRFVAYDNGTVLDTKTGLMWAAKDNGEDINWQGAKKYCESYRSGGYTDWRLPTLDELEGLYNENKTGYVQGCYGRNKLRLTELIRLTCCCPWASDTESGSSAGLFDFGDGFRGWSQPSSSYVLRALPVR